jgi:hypothetical protein
MPSAEQLGMRAKFAAQREVRAPTVAKMYLRGMSFRAIAAALKIDFKTVGKDIEYCRGIWRENSLKTFETHLAEQLAKLDEAEAAAWDGWERSQMDDVQTSTEETESPDGPITKTKMSRRGQSGQAAYLATVTKIVELRCKLLGLLDKDAAEQSIATANFNVVSIVVDSREQAEEMRTLTVDQFRKKVEGEKTE